MRTDISPYTFQSVLIRQTESRQKKPLTIEFFPSFKPSSVLFLA